MRPVDARAKYAARCSPTTVLPVPAAPRILAGPEKGHPLFDGGGEHPGQERLGHLVDRQQGGLVEHRLGHAHIERHGLVAQHRKVRAHRLVDGILLALSQSPPEAVDVRGCPPLADHHQAAQARERYRIHRGTREHHHHVHFTRSEPQLGERRLGADTHVGEPGQVVSDVSLTAEDAASRHGHVAPALRVHHEDTARPHEHVVDLRATTAPRAGPAAVVQEGVAARGQRRERAGDLALGTMGDHPPLGCGTRLSRASVMGVSERYETARLVARRPACLAHASPRCWLAKKPSLAPFWWVAGSCGTP
jgi:hypothetical protein